MDLIRQFEAYYQSPVTPSWRLLEAVSHYDFSDYGVVVREVAALKAKYANGGVEKTLVKSNGSTDESDGSYPFGPHFGYWCPKVEKVLRDFDVQVRLAHFGVREENIYYVRPWVFQDNLIYLDLANPENRADLISIVADMAERHGRKISLCAKPSTWLLLSTDTQAFADFLVLRPHVESLINEDWELWTKPNLPEAFFMNDQMIDWRTGVNFYTCRHGTKHFLPIFYTYDRFSSNLLNLATDEVVCADLMEVSEDRRLCGCGRYYLPFHFRPQRDYYLDLPREIIHNLGTGFINFQVVQLGDRLHVLYSTIDGSEQEFGFLDDPLVYKDHMYVSGRKKYNFWKSGRSDLSPSLYVRPGMRKVKLL